MNIIFPDDELAKIALTDWGFAENLGKLGAILAGKVEEALREQFKSDDSLYVMLGWNGKLSFALPFSDDGPWASIDFIDLVRSEIDTTDADELEGLRAKLLEAAALIGKAIDESTK